MLTKVQKWGNSFAVRLPMDFVRRFGLRVGSMLEKREIEDAIVIKPVRKQKHETLAQLVARITPANKHTVVDWGVPVGKEIW